jgi:heme exporter protein B
VSEYRPAEARAEAPPMRPSYLDQLLALYWKDLLAESRSREVVSSSLLFALMVLVLLNFAFDLRVERAAAAGPGVLWVAFTFAGVLTLGRAFAREHDRGTLEGLLLAPIDPSTLYLAKVLASATFMALVEAVSLPAFVALFNVSLDWGLTLLVVLLGTIGFAGVGTLLAAMAANARAREALLPLLLFPLVVPVLIATVKATGQAIGGTTDDGHPWIGLLVAFDAIFLAVPLLIFNYVVEP